MPRPTINPTDEFYRAVSEYQAQHNIQSWSQAVLKLAAIGLKSETGQEIHPAKDEWGRKSPNKSK